MKRIAQTRIPLRALSVLSISVLMLVALSIVTSAPSPARAADYAYTEEFRGLDEMNVIVVVNLGTGVPGDAAAIEERLTSHLVDELNNALLLDVAGGEAGDDNNLWINIDLWPWEEVPGAYHGSVKAELLRAVRLAGGPDDSQPFYAAVWAENFAAVAKDDDPTPTLEQAADLISSDFIDAYWAAVE